MNSRRVQINENTSLILEGMARKIAGVAGAGLVAGTIGYVHGHNDTEGYQNQLNNELNNLKNSAEDKYVSEISKTPDAQDFQKKVNGYYHNSWFGKDDSSFPRNNQEFLASPGKDQNINYSHTIDGVKGRGTYNDGDTIQSSLRRTIDTNPGMKDAVFNQARLGVNDLGVNKIQNKFQEIQDKNNNLQVNSANQGFSTGAKYGAGAAIAYSARNKVKELGRGIQNAIR